MKNFKFYSSIIASVFLMLASSCSNENAPELEQKDTTELDNVEFMNQLTRSEVSATYERSGMEYFIMYNNSGKWKQIDAYTLLGAEEPCSNIITFHEGKSWSPMRWFHCAGFNKLYFPLMAYRHKTGFKKEFYIACPMNYNSETNELKIEGKTFQKEYLNDKAMKVNCAYSNCYTNDSGEVYASQQVLWKMTYIRSDFAIRDYGNIAYYETEFDAEMAILTMLRAEFGNEVNVNEYITGGWLDNPIFNFDEVEKEIRKKHEIEQSIKYFLANTTN